MANECESLTFILFPHFIYIKLKCLFEFAEIKYLLRSDLDWKGGCVCLQHVHCVVWAQGFNILTGKIPMRSLCQLFLLLSHSYMMTHNHKLVQIHFTRDYAYIWIPMITLSVGMQCIVYVTLHLTPFDNLMLDYFARSVWPYWWRQQWAKLNGIGK